MRKQDEEGGRAALVCILSTAKRDKQGRRHRTHKASDREVQVSAKPVRPVLRVTGHSCKIKQIWAASQEVRQRESGSRFVLKSKKDASHVGRNLIYE